MKEENGDVEVEDVEEEKEEETEWRPGMRLTTSSLSWMWKNNRKDLASKENRNKAGKKNGKGTTNVFLSFSTALLAALFWLVVGYQPK